MKQNFLFFLLLLGTYVCTAQTENTIRVTEKINEVTVYLSGAEIRSSQQVSLTKDRNRVVFRGLSPELVEESMQVSAGAGIEIVSITTQAYSLPIEEANPRIRHQTDTISALKQRIELLTNQIDAYQNERKLLAENQHLGGKDAAVPITELIKAADFYQDRTLKINNALTALNLQIGRLKTRIDSATTTITKLSNNIRTTYKEVTILLNAATAQTADIQLRYVVTNASWTATYDLISTDISEPITLRYKAQIYNNTSIDWKNTRLILSTGDPSLEASRPYLTAWTLNWDQNISTPTSNEGLMQNQNLQNQNISQMLNGRIYGVATPSNSYDEIMVSELAATFKLDKLHTILSHTSTPYLTSVSEQKLTASYEYLSIPKVDMSAFLLAKVTGWQKLNLIDGQANIYVGNTYIGQSAIQTRQMGDTLDLSLGRDNQVLVKRSKVEDFSEVKSINNKKVETLVYEISVKNNKSKAITIKIQDQVPVSQESDITVEPEDLSAAELDVPSGRLQWKRTINPGESLRLRVSFSVKYPKNKNLILRKSRIIRTPRFK